MIDEFMKKFKAKLKFSFIIFVFRLQIQGNFFDFFCLIENLELSYENSWSQYVPVKPLLYGKLSRLIRILTAEFLRVVNFTNSLPAIQLR